MIDAWALMSAVKQSIEFEIRCKHGSAYQSCDERIRKHRIFVLNLIFHEYCLNNLNKDNITETARLHIQNPINEYIV